MNGLSAGLGFHQALAQGAMTDLATRVRPVLVPDGQGGETQGTPDRSLSFPCRLYGNERTPMEQPQAGRVVAVMQWQLAMPVGTDLRPEDQVEVKTKTFEVIDLDEARSVAALTWVNLREVD